MKLSYARPVPCSRRFLTHWMALAAFLTSGVATLYGATSVTIVRIEEDWQLVVNNPETSSNSPQVTCAMSPATGDDGNYVSFELNHQSQPGYASGGLHLHAWEGDYLLASAHTQHGDTLRTSDETVNWTQSMSIGDGVLTYEVTNGSSETWGDFGTGELKLSFTSSLANLNGYQVENSVRGSGVGFGSNRVSSLKLKTVRYFVDTGEVVEVHVNHDVLGNNN